MLIRKTPWRNESEPVIVIMAVLLLLGTINVFSSSFVLATTSYNNPYYFLIRHAVWLVLGIFVFVQVCFKVFQLFAQVVDLVVGVGDILVDAVHGLCHLTQQLAHGLDDLAFFGVLINAEAVDQALQVCSFFLHREYLLSQNSSSF